MAESKLGAHGAAAAGSVAQDAASTGEVAIDPNAVYSLGSSSGESERLLRQAEELASESEALLDRVELGPGDSAIDLGCGPCGVLELLYRRVFPRGRVVGLDSDPAHVEMAAEFVSKRGLDGVEVVAADARNTGLHEDSFDVVHARTLLINVPEPEKVLAEMVRAMRPQILALGAADDRELEELDATVRRHLDNPEVVAMDHLRFLSWGRKPTVV